MPSRFGASASRKGAGEASRAAAACRNTKKRADPLCAARFSRRSASARTCDCQSKTTAHVPARSTCSAAQSASAVRGAGKQTKRAGSTPQYARASGCSVCGGWISTIGLPAARASTGTSSRSSPIPVCCASSSTSAPAGQPPPGSSADSAGWPVSTPRALARGNWAARQRLGWIRSGWARAGFTGHAHKHCINIQCILAQDFEIARGLSAGAGAKMSRRPKNQRLTPFATDRTFC